MKEYAEIFELRGSSYDSAMLAYPEARRAEFEQVIAPIPLRPGMIIGDVPAGGGYLRRYLPEDCSWTGHEPCPEFTAHGARDDSAARRPLLPLPWQDNALDAAVSLAAVHHIEDKVPLFRELARVIAPGGTFVLSDVAEGSAPARFLDGFVGSWNSTGHQGSFLNADTCRQLEEAGWTVTDARMNQYLWRFPDRGALTDFTWQLFDIRRASHELVERTVASELGIEELPEGGVGMNWSLMTITCRKREPGRRA